MKQLMQKMFYQRKASSNLAALEPLVVAPVLEVHKQAPVQTTNPVDVSLSDDALAINEAKLCHLASLGLNIAGKKVLEVGGGIGLHTCFFESLGCEVLFTEARPENLAEARRRYPNRKSMLLDLDTETDLSHLGRFADIQFPYFSVCSLQIHKSSA